MGFVFWLVGELIFFHASHAGKAVVAVRLEAYLRRYLGGPSVCGIYVQGVAALSL